MDTKSIRIRGARVHNLKNISLNVPRNSLVVITGVSGSGKSSLAFDTLYAEGQRRYIESLSSYARQFLGALEKPDVDSIDGLSPAIAIEQTALLKNPRSTVGTVTEVYDYLRLLFSHIGEPHCPDCGSSVEPKTPQEILSYISAQISGEVTIAAPLVFAKKGTHHDLLSQHLRDGINQWLIDGVMIYSDKVPVLDKNKTHTIIAIIDTLDATDTSLLDDAIKRALVLSGGIVEIYQPSKGGKLKRLQRMSTSRACIECGVFFEKFEPRFFSFNTPLGACEKCSGVGELYIFHEDQVVPDKTISIADGAIKGLRAALGESFRIQRVGEFLSSCGASIFTPFGDLHPLVQKGILHHVDDALEAQLRATKIVTDKNCAEIRSYEGVVPLLERLYKQADSAWRKRDFEKFMRVSHCGECNGARLSKKVRAVTVCNKSIVDIAELSVDRAIDFFNTIQLSEQQKIITSQIMREVVSRLQFLQEVGLGYITIARRMETLSGGESQRVKLATQIGSALTGVMYVLDEPSIGLHQRDNERLVQTLLKLKQLGNTVIVVEHDEDTMYAADHIIDIGPGAGVHGGYIVAEGTAKDLERNEQSITGQYLIGAKKCAPQKTELRELSKPFTIVGACGNNLKNLTVPLYAHVLNVVTGVSGSGKSTLINDILARSLAAELSGSTDTPGKHTRIEHAFKNVVIVDQSPIGRTPRSNPATYVKLFDEIRHLFASTRESQIRGYKEGRFSFNVPGGRCEKCCGDGVLCMEMHFLPDVYVTCEECAGKRYNQETLVIKYKDKNIYDVLNMSVDEACEFFKAVPTIAKKLQTLRAVGLGYILLGQSATTLSGGEAQRIKLSRELSKRSAEDTIYILDEPTTGLHFEDIHKLLLTLDSLIDRGATCVVIEHNLDVIAHADYIIDLGPEGGEAGGSIIACGRPDEICACKSSHTGKFLKAFLDKNRERKERYDSRIKKTSI